MLLLCCLCPSPLYTTWHLALEAGRVARRFPLTLLCATALCAAGCQTIYFSSHGDNPDGGVFPLLSTSALGLPLTLVVLYLGILYGYLGRILWLRALPQGWVSVLILALAVAGIFALLLIHPLRDSPDNAWMRTFARWFYRALFPLLGLLAVAIGVRVYDYGITEERYFVRLLAA